MNGVIYARFSDGPKQTYKSIEGQVRDCLTYADQKGIKIVNTYIDEHISGKDFEGRASFQRLMKDAQKKAFDCVIVWKIDRLGRNREELAISKAKLKRCGVHVHYAMEHIPDGPEGIILESLMEGLAEYYSADLAQKVARGMRESILSGKMINGNACFGYQLIDRHYVPDPDTASLVPEIFERYAGGETAKEICFDFARRGIKSAAGVDLQPKSIYKILRNEKYTGLYRYSDIVIPDFHERLVSDELFKEVQNVLSKNARNKGPKSRRDPVDYLLTGKLYCGLCKSSMRGESGTGKHGDIHHYYKCSGRKERKNNCTMQTFRKEELESCVIRITQQDVLTDQTIDALVCRVMEMQNAELESPVLKGMQKSLREKEKGINNIMAAIEAGIITPTTKERLMTLESERDSLRAEILREKWRKTSYTPEEVRFYLESFRDGAADNPDFCRRLIEVFVNRIYVYEDYIVVIYNFSDPDGERHDLADLADEAIKKEGEKGSKPLSPAGREGTGFDPAAIAFVTLHYFGVIIKRHILESRHYG